MKDPIPVPVHAFFAAMQGGATSEAALMALFAEDAVYAEPFTGELRIHAGKSAIRAALQAGWKTPLPEMRIEIDRVHVADGCISATWTCHSPALPGGMGRGENSFTLRDGLIVRLETRLSGAPPPSKEGKSKRRPG
jgi:ketosteroid isomerase-like protein